MDAQVLNVWAGEHRRLSLVDLLSVLEAPPFKLESSRGATYTFCIVQPT